MARAAPIRAAGIAACIVSVSSLALFSVTGGNGSPRNSSESFFAQAAEQPGITRLDDAPPSITASSFAAWSGPSLLVWGPKPGSVGSGYAGATYDTAAGSWKAWPPWPYPDPVVDPHVVWTGEQLVVVGTACTNTSDGYEGLECSPGTLVGAEYAPGNNEWKAIELPAEANRGRKAGGDGGCCTTVGLIDGDALFQINDQVFAWSPSSESWSTLPLPPTAHIPSHYCNADDQSLAPLEGTEDVGNEVLQISRSITPLLLDRGWRWSTAPSFSPGLTDLDAITGFCGGSSQMLALSADWKHAASWNSARGTWVQIPAPTIDLSRTYLGIAADQVRGVNAPVSFGFSAWTGSSYVWWNTPFTVRKPAPNLLGPEQVTMEANAVSFTPGSDEWSPAAPGPPTLADGLAWRDGVGYTVAADDFGSPALLSYYPILTSK